MALRINPRASRRAILAGFLATIAHPGFAGGDGSGGSGFRKNPAVKSVYPQSEFSRLSREEVNQLYFRYTQQQFTLVNGFSLNMSSLLILMATSQRRRTGRLIREMADIKDKNKRKARLRKELHWADDQLGKLKASLKRAEEKGRKNAVEETKLQLVLINRYRDGLLRWINAPGEGQR